MAKLDILITATNQASGPVNAAKRALEGLGSAAKVTTLAAGAAATAAIAGVTAAIGVGVKKAADLEQGVADIASVMGVTFQEAAPLKELISDLGMDPRLKVTATEASDAIMQLAQSGMSMQEILDGAARSTVLLSNATGGDMATSAAIASDAMSLFGIQATDMARAVNGITGVTVASKFGINDYQLALSQAGGVAAAVGVSFEDFNTTIAAISPYFASGSDAGTSFKTMLQRLVPASGPAEEAMKALGLITADGANQFFDANGNMRDMSEIAGLLQGALGGLTEEQKNAALSTIFGTDAMRAAVALAEAGTGTFDELAGSIGKIDAEASAATRMDTLSGAMEILDGVIDGLLTQIGDAFLPLVRQLTDWAIAFATAHGPKVTEWFNGLAQWMQGGIPIFLEWSQRAVWAIGEVLNWLHGGDEQFTQLGAIWGKVTSIITGIVVTTIQYVRDHWQDWVNVLLEWGGLFASWATNLWAIYIQPGLATMWANLRAWLDENAGGLGTKLEIWTTNFLNVVRDIIAGWQEAWPEIQGIVVTAASSIGESVGSILESLNKIGGWFDNGGEGGGQFRITWADFWTFLATVVAGSLDLIVRSINMALDAFVALGEAVQAIGTGDWARLAGAGDIAKGIALQMADFMSDWTLIANGVQPRAAGGPVAAGMPYWVGEQGAEMFVPEQAGTIVPGDRIENNTNHYWTVNLAGGSGAGNDVLSSVQLLTALYG